MNWDARAGRAMYHQTEARHLMKRFRGTGRHHPRCLLIDRKSTPFESPTEQWLSCSKRAKTTETLALHVRINQPTAC